MISIITPTYNREVLVQETIKSILGQTYNDWELILVDDGSTDNTEQAIQKYLSDDRIRYIKKHNSGQASSLNIGVGYAKGDFIVFLDSDDIAYPNWLEVAAANIKDNTGILSVGAVRKFSNGHSVQEGMNTWKLYGKTWHLKFTCGSLFIRRSAFNAIGGYDAELKSNIQTDLGYRLVAYLQQTNLQAVILPNQYLVQINIHEGERIRTNWRKRRDGGIQFLNKHYRFIYENDRKEIANICATIAFSSYKLKQRMQSLEYLLKAIKHNPLHGVNYLRILKYAFL